MSFSPGPVAHLQPEFRVLDEAPGEYAFTAFQNVTFFAWARQITGPDVERLRQATEPLYRGSGHARISVVHIATVPVGVPTPEARDGLVRLLQERFDRRGCMGIVLLQGGGFWTSAIRGFLTSLSLLTSKRATFGLYEDVESASRWLSANHGTTTGVRIEADSLARLLTQTAFRCSYAASLRAPAS